MNEIVQAMVTRRSCRQYWDRPVPEELLDQVLLAGTYAANGRGRQAGRIVVLTKKEDITALEKLNAQALGNPEAQPFYGAPVVLVPCLGVASHLLTSIPELVASIGGKNALCDMLLDIVRGYTDDPFAWGKDPHEAVHNAVVLEEVAKMASRCELINPQVKPAPQELQDKHYYRKHGANAYYGQIVK